jgi:hypothetical protein
MKAVQAWQMLGVHGFTHAALTKALDETRDKGCLPNQIHNGAVVCC